VSPLRLVRLDGLMARTRGRPDVRIGLIDGPVLTDHAELERERFVTVTEEAGATCSRPDSVACLHGTFIAGILASTRQSTAPAICPDCTVLVRPIYRDTLVPLADNPVAGPRQLAAAIVDTIDAGARIVNVSLGVSNGSLGVNGELSEALNYASRRGTIIVAAAGNQGEVGASLITRHPSVIPVVACDLHGRVLNGSNVGRSIGIHGLLAPGQEVTSLGAHGGPLALSGTSVATPFVSGTIALLWSAFPSATPAAIRRAVSQSWMRRRSITPPLLDAEAAYDALAERTRG